jgi:hypothetical protein
MSMPSTLDRFKADLESLIERGKALQMAMQLECHGEAFRKAVKEQLKTKAEAYLKELPDFKRDYQRWYTEAHAVVKQLIPDRLNDFVRYHEKPRTRKEVSYGNYCMEDYLQNLRVTRGGYEVIVDSKAAIPQFDQQVAIVEAARTRFASSLLDIRQVLQADLFDSELQAAEHLAKYKFFRAAGALAGVVLERHLGQVCLDHAVTVAKKNPTIADFNEALKAADVIDLPQWRFIQHLADVRNLCDHAKKPDPTAEQVGDLLAGTTKVIKTVL